jgi:diguanylate cyclase (GGDEF)-like protein/PAS domain S-box-containing protein
MKRQLSVLLVDDDEDEYILLKDMFARLPGRGNGIHYTLDWASTYEAGLEACGRKSYDLHLVDYHLGSRNGLDLLREAAEHGCQAPSILLTGQGSYELDLAAMQQGVYDYLLKDQINEWVLERTIRYALERRQTEEELEQRVRERTSELTESEARFRALAETTSAAIFIVQDGLIRYANPAARFVTGYQPEQLLGMELWRLAHPAYQAPLRESRLATHWTQNHPARYEIKLISHTGEERWVDLTAGNMLLDGRPALVYTAFDITERDRAEQSLRKSEAALRKARDELEQRVASRTAEIQAASQRFQTVLRTLPVGIVVADEHGRIIEGNADFRALWDSPDALTADINTWPTLQAWDAETGRPMVLRDWLTSRSVIQGEAINGQMIDILSLAGQRKTILYSAAPIHSPDGQVIGGVAVTQDITAQRKLEQQAQAAAQEAQQRAEELEGLHRATSALLSTLDLDELLRQILDAAQSAIPASEKGMLHLVSPTTGQLQVRATLGFSDERISVIRSTKGPGFPARVARERRPLLVNDIQAGARSEVDLEGISPEMGTVRSIILAPLYYGDQVLGTLSLSAEKPHAFSASNLRLLASFAATTTAALQNAILHAEIKQLAVTDPLTGQYNRRAFFDLGQREMERFLRFNHPLSAVMIDLDNFKHINDTYGHAAGDQVLRMLAQRCRAKIRDTDIFGRYGGDEFALLLPDTDLLTAEHIATRIRDSLTGSPFATEAGPVIVSASLGVTRGVKSHRVLEDLLGEADKALYEAKEKGRNRVEVK